MIKFREEMKIDTTIRGWIESFIYIIGGAFAWIESTGLNTYVFTVLAGFMSLDMLLGWIKAKVVPELENPTSKRAKRGILAKSVMFVIPVVVGLIWGALGDKSTAMRVVNVQLTGLMIAEGYSNIANAYAIYAKEELSEFDAVTFVLKKIAHGIRNLLDRFMNDDK